jgi:hypothetical protein
MKTYRTVVFTAALISVAGTAFAGDATETESASLFSDQPAAVEFTPMTRSERLRNYLTGTFGPTSFVKAAASAGLSQLTDHPKEWGQGSQGYADRLGNAYAKHIIRRTLEYGAATALHEDDRYLASGQAGFWNRTKYAVSSAFLARRENGQRTFALARVSSAAGAAFISRAWQPASVSGAQSAAGSFGFTLATDIGSNVVREFWPDLKRGIRRK